MTRLVITALGLSLAFCGGEKRAQELQLFEKSAFDKIVDGKNISLYTLHNKNGMTVQLTNYGARIVDLWVPSKDGKFKDVVMGFETIDAYLKANDIYNGPVVGRYGNRIGKGNFTLNGVKYQLTINDGENHLHGGTGGFGQMIWDVVSAAENEIKMRYISPDGEEGYPGNLELEVNYTLTENNELVIRYLAKTDAPTVINPTSHSYFNLHGINSSSTNSHILTIYADKYTPTDKNLIPTGEISSIENTPLDFRRATPIGDRINFSFEALVSGRGYDHNWILMKNGGSGEIELAAEVYEPSTGIVLKVLTDQPAIQFYSGNFMTGNDVGKRGNINNYRTGIALETQNYPDAPNHANFPSAILNPGETYSQTCIYKFELKK